MKFITYIIFYLLAIQIVTSCSPRISGHGNLVSKTQIDDIIKSKSSTEETISRIGNPTFIDEKDGETMWFYTFYQLSKNLFLPTKFINQEIYIIKFDKNNQADSFVFYDKDAINYIALSDTHIPVAQEHSNVLKNLLSNLRSVNSIKTY